MIENLLEPIRTAYTNGQLEHATQLCADALAAHPDSGELHNLAAAVAARSERLETARHHASRARQLAPNNSSFHLNAAMIDERAGNLTDAIVANNDVLKLHPDHGVALANLANIARLQHQDAKALDLYARAHSVNPGNATLLANWASLLSLREQHDAALEKIDSALGLEPNAPDYIASRADILAAAQRFDDAIGQYAAALEGLPLEARVPVLSNLAITLLKMRRGDEALQRAEQVDALDRGNRTAAAVRYIVAAQSGDADIAQREMNVDRFLSHRADCCPEGYPSTVAFLTALQREVLAHPSLAFEPNSKTTRGGLQSANLVPDADPAIRALHAMLERAVYAYLNDHDGRTLEAARPMQNFRLNIWVTVLNTGGQQLPHIHPAGVLSGVYYVAVPDSKPSRSGGEIEFGQPPDEYGPFADLPARLLTPRAGDLLLFPSQFYHRTLPFAHAEQRISVAFDVIPCAHDADVPPSAVNALQRAKQHLSARDFAGAHRLLTPLTQQVADYAEAWFVAGKLALQTGQHAAAVQHLKRAIKLRPRVAPWWHQLGITQQRLLDYPSARESLARCLALLPDHEPALMTLASLHTDQGEADDALEVYRRIIDQRAAAGRAWYGLALQKVKAITSKDVTTMRTALDSGQPVPADRVGLHFALGRALEHAKEYGDAFAQFAAGNQIKHDAQPFDSTAEQRNAKAICQAFTPAVFDHFDGSGCPSDAPVLIVGMPRSGSTLTEQILASHPDVAAAGETNALWRTLSDLGRYLPAGKQVPADILAVPKDAWRALGEQYVDGLRADAGAEAPRLTDKLPFNYTLLGMLRLMLPNAFIVDARRHPMDTCWSCFATSFGVDRGFTNSLNDLGITYRTYDELMAHWREVLRKPIYTARYEATIADIEGEARALLSYLALEWHDDCLQFHRTKRAVTTSSYAQVRQPIYTSSVERWRRFEPFLTPLREALGPSLAAYDETTA
ncbi:MAG: sulfotransferase [Gammaproteobacteria bacterium]